MPSRFRVMWTESASADPEDIIRFIAKDSLVNARKVYKRLHQRAASLRTFPGRGHIVPELLEVQITDYVELAVQPYRIIYRIQKPDVFVVAVLDARRDLREILAERLLRAK